eukprot:TRINITY_DN13059_c0_g1_i1.p1 TRINITY_DN13059_c0_g1~~TRINITY_DN13059_c0_g1_i1.p1  ORF type:complete len:184 (+),score=34.61 TRINITY_DN13059_c0_g1_i1:73-552(+)
MLIEETISKGGTEEKKEKKREKKSAMLIEETISKGEQQLRKRIVKERNKHRGCSVSRKRTPQQALSHNFQIRDEKLIVPRHLPPPSHTINSLIQDTVYLQQRVTKIPTVSVPKIKRKFSPGSQQHFLPQLVSIPTSAIENSATSTIGIFHSGTVSLPAI